MSDQADEESGSEPEHYIIYDYDGDLYREWAAEQEREKLNIYRKSRQLHPGYAFNKDIDAHLENLDVETRRLQDNVQRIGNLVSNLNLDYPSQINNSQQEQITQSNVTKPKSKPKQLSIQESIDLQQKILSGSG